MKPFLTRFSLGCLLWLLAITGYSQSLTVNVTPHIICLGQGIEISAFLSGADSTKVTSYVFSFGHPALGGDTFVSNIGNPVRNSTFHLYSVAGVYRIKITANFSNRSPLTGEIIDTVYNLPIAQFALTSNDSQCFKGNSYCFKNLSAQAVFPSLPMAGMIQTYGDGDSTSMALGATVCHAYTKGNTFFRPAMEVVDVGGCRAKIIKSIYIAPNLDVRFSLSGNPKCDTTPYIFVNTTPGSLSNVLWFRWEFGDSTVYASPNPIINASAEVPFWSGFVHNYYADGVFNPKLVMRHKFLHCADSFSYSQSGNTLPENKIIKIDIRSRRNTGLGQDSISDSVCTQSLLTGAVCLFNAYKLQGQNAQILVDWGYNDPNAKQPGISDHFSSEIPPCYPYQPKALGQYFPTLKVTCPNKPPRIFNFWSRIDTAHLGDSQYSPPPITNPVITSINGYQFKGTDEISQFRQLYAPRSGPSDTVDAIDTTLEEFTVFNHGLVVGDWIKFWSVGSMTGVSNYHNYIVKTATTNTFTLSTKLKLTNLVDLKLNVVNPPGYVSPIFQKIRKIASDSLPTYVKWFNNDSLNLDYFKKRSQLLGFGINIMGPLVQVEDPPAGVTMNPFLKTQCGPDFPVEFTNATNLYQSNNLFIRWDFTDEFAPKCTSFSVGGTKPFTNGTDLLARSLGRFVTGGVIYPGRVNCGYSHDTLPIHSFPNWKQVEIWYKYGHDFPPYDSSANGWTKDPTKVTWPIGSGPNYTGKKLVHPSDTAAWGKPLYSAGPTPSRIDTLIRMWPADKNPNTKITLRNDIPDPLGIARGYYSAVIKAQSKIDTAGFITPIPPPLPDRSLRRYHGNTQLPGSSGTLYDYFFKRGVTACYFVKLTMADSFNNQSGDPIRTKGRINMINGNITILQISDTIVGTPPIVQQTSVYSYTAVPPNPPSIISNDTVIYKSDYVLSDNNDRIVYRTDTTIRDYLVYNYKKYTIQKDPVTNQKFIMLSDDEFKVDSFDCGFTATVKLPLVGVDAYGLGQSGKICPGLNALSHADPHIHFSQKDTFPGVMPSCSERTYLLMNFDSILDRHDLTPCALDGFVDFQGNSPMTNSNVTPGGSTFPAFNNGVDFNPVTAWTSIAGDFDIIHYQPKGSWAYSNMPFDKKGYVTIGIILGTGHAFPGSSLPGCLSDTVWYHNFFHFITLNAYFTYKKVGGYSMYNNASLPGSPSVLPSQDYLYDTALTSPTYFEPWSRLYGRGDILQFVTQVPKQDFVAVDYWDWLDGTITIDSFFTNITDTFVHTHPLNQNDSTFFVKGSYPVDRIRYEINTKQAPGLPNPIDTFYRPYPIGVHVFDTLIAETIWQCTNLTHQGAPQSITYTSTRIDTAFFILPINHQFKKTSYEMTFPNTQETQRFPDLASERISHTIYTTEHCDFAFERVLVIGVIDTFTIKNNDNILCVGEVGEFTDSIRYWNANANGLVNPSRVLPPFATELVYYDFHGEAMIGYPIDSIKTFVNLTKAYKVASISSTCPIGWVHADQGVAPLIIPYCSKIDTAFYERIYWDFESDGVIDYAGHNSTHKFSTPGRFKVSMITRDSVGYWDTCAMFVDVVAPHANFTTKSVFKCGEPTSFNDSTYINDDCYMRTGISCDQVAERKWWFGDIGYGPFSWRSTVKNPLYVYGRNGWFTLQESILTEQGCVDTVRKSIYIAGPRPRIKLLGDTIGCAPYTLKILSYPNDSGISITGATFFEFGRPDKVWNYNSKANPDTVTVTYDKEGVYSIRAIGYDQNPGNLCPGIFIPDTVKGREKLIKIYVQNPYKVKLDVSKHEVCVGEVFKVMNNSNLDTITKFRLYTYNSDTAIIDTSYKTNFPADKSFQYVLNKPGTFELVLHSTRFVLGAPECSSKDTVKVIARKAKADLKVDSIGLPQFYITNLSDSANASAYIWRIYNPDGSLRDERKVSGNSDPNFNYGILNLQNDTGEFKICIVVTTNSIQNCNDSVCKTVINNFITKLNIPNVFSPNNDGINDEFVIKIEGEELYDLKIWNRWGGEVFESTDSKKVWNGHTQNVGAENPDGTYYFIFKYRLRTHSDQIVRGTITLIR